MSNPILPPRWFSMVATLSSWAPPKPGVRGPDKAQRRAFVFKRLGGREGFAESVWRELEHRRSIPVAELAERANLPPSSVRHRLSYALSADVLLEVDGRVVRGDVRPEGEL